MYSTIVCKKFLSGLPFHDLGRSLNVDAISMLSNSSFGVKYFSHNTNSNGVQPNKTQLQQSSFLRPTPNSISCITSIDNHRHYCSKNYRPFPEVPEFPPIIWPNVFKSIKALLYSYLIIKPQLDKDFSLGEFAKNSRKVCLSLQIFVVTLIFLLYFKRAIPNAQTQL